MTTKRQALENEKQEAIARLRAMLKPGSTVYTILRHVSRSGMSRTIGAQVIKDGEPVDIAAWAAKAIGQPLDRDRWGVKMGGCGMDMGFELVYNLSYWLFKNSGFYCIGEGCPANDHSNDGMRPEGRTSTDYSPDRKHSDPGYALKQRWL